MNWMFWFVILITPFIGYLIWLVREFFLESIFSFRLIRDKVSKLSEQVDGLEANLESSDLSMHKHLNSIQNSINSISKDGDYNWLDKTKEPDDD
jgi:hypothetical protein